MGRNRRMPPLFEVMRQTNPGSPLPANGPASPGQPGNTPPGAPSDPVRNQTFFRGPGAAGPQPETAGNAALRLTPRHTEEGDEHPAAARAPSPGPSAPSAPAVTKPVEVRVGQARRNWVVQDTDTGPDADDSTPRAAGARKAPTGIPGMWIAAAAAIAVSLLVIVWIVAYRQGSTAKDLEYQGKLSSSAPSGPSTPVTPTRGATNPNSRPAGASGLPPEHRPAREPEAQPPKTPAKADPGASKPQQVPVAPASVDTAPAVDPRHAETNYLSVLTFREKADAVELAKYLTAGGVPAATMALKASGGTSVGWEVFVLQGIPSADFRRADDTRNTIHRKLEDLGRKWNQEGRSRLNLSRDNVTWRKFKPGS